ncbi:14-3-3-like protein [Fagus crenata]
MPSPLQPPTSRSKGSHQRPDLKAAHHRPSWPIISSIEQKKESHGNEDYISMIHDYRSKIESDLSNICNGILKLLDTRLILSSSTSDSKVFYLKNKCDCHRFLVEFKTGTLTA